MRWITTGRPAMTGLNVICPPRFAAVGLAGVVPGWMIGAVRLVVPLWATAADARGSVDPTKPGASAARSSASAPARKDGRTLVLMRPPGQISAPKDQVRQEAGPVVRGVGPHRSRRRLLGCAPCGSSRPHEAEEGRRPARAAGRRTRDLCVAGAGDDLRHAHGPEAR